MAKKKQTYQQAIDEIENILLQIENDELNVDAISIKVKRVSELLRFCKSQLKSTEDEVDNILEELEGN